MAKWLVIHNNENALILPEFFFPDRPTPTFTNKKKMTVNKFFFFLISRPTDWTKLPRHKSAIQGIN